MTTDEPIKLTFPSFTDSRGIFKPIPLENFHARQVAVVQSHANVIRGMHGQKHPYAQGKLLTVLRGKIKDVVIDVPRNTTWIFELNPGEGLWVPPHCLHGYAALETSEVLYVVDQPYRPEQEWGIHPLDSFFKIDWGVSSPIISEKDQKLPTFREWLEMED